MRRSVVTVAALAAGIGLLGVAPASADHPTSAVTPTLISPDAPPRECDDVLDPGDFDTQLKIEPVTAGDYPFSNGVSGTVTIIGGSPALTFDFEVDGAVAVTVLVKGGPDGNWYDYRPLGGVSSDVDLHAPDTPAGPPAGLSNVIFCLAEAPPDDEVPPDDDDDDVDDEVPAPAPAVEVEPVFTG